MGLRNSCEFYLGRYARMDDEGGMLLYLLRGRICLRNSIKGHQKKTTPQQIAHAFQLTKQVGMKTKMLLMVGNPGEDDTTVNDTVRMIETVHPDFVSVSEAMVFPGTELYESAKQKGFVSDDYWLTDRPAPYFTVENNLEKLLEWSNTIMSANAGIVGKGLRRLLKYAGTKNRDTDYNRGGRV